jgi:hypothetical protein
MLSAVIEVRPLLVHGHSVSTWHVACVPADYCVRRETLRYFDCALTPRGSEHSVAASGADPVDCCVAMKRWAESITHLLTHSHLEHVDCCVRREPLPYIGYAFTPRTSSSPSVQCYALLHCCRRRQVTRPIIPSNGKRSDTSDNRAL